MTSLDDIRPTSPEMDLAERIDADARPGATGPLEEADYRPPLFQHTGEALELGDRAAERSPLELGAAFLGSHQVVEALAAGQEPLVTYSVLKAPDGGLHVLATFHGEEGGRVTEPELDFAHSVLLDTLRRQIDLATTPGTAAMRLFLMAVDPDPLAEASAREQPGPDPEMPDDGVPHEEEGGVAADDDDDE